MDKRSSLFCLFVSEKEDKSLMTSDPSSHWLNQRQS